MEKEKDGIKPVYQHNFYNKEVEKNFTHIFEIKKNVYSVYENGTDSRKKPVIKLFIAILALLGILSGGTVLAYTLYENQERTWLTFDETGEEDVEYVLNLNISNYENKKNNYERNFGP